MTTSLTQGTTSKGVTSTVAHKVTNHYGKIRAVLSGAGTATRDVKHSVTGASLMKGGAMAGYNLGVYEYYSVAEADAWIKRLKGMGVQIVRLVGFFRGPGSPSKDLGDSWAPGRYNNVHIDNWNKLKAFARACERNGMWFIVVGEGDINQAGTQDQPTYDRSVTLVQSFEVIPGSPTNTTWLSAGGYNLFTSAYLRAIYYAKWRQVAREFRSYDYLYAYELCSEPLPNGGSGLYTAGYDYTWSSRSPGPGLGRYSVEQLLRELIQIIQQTDPYTHFIVGGRGGYNLQQDVAHSAGEFAEIVAALSDATGLGGNLVAKNILEFTWDRLSDASIAWYNTAGAYQFAATFNVHLFMNQVGTRCGDDLNDMALMHGVSLARTRGVISTIWDGRGNTANGYGFQYANGGQDAHGQNGTYADVTTRIANLGIILGKNMATLEAEAKAAAIASNAVLFYAQRNSDGTYANIYQDAAGTNKVTAIDGSQRLGLIKPVTDPLATGLTWTPVNTGVGFPIVRPAESASAVPDQYPSFIFDGVNTILMPVGNATYWPNTQQALAASICGVPATQSIAQTFLTLGTSGTTVRFPRIQSSAAKKLTFQMEGDDAVQSIITGNTTMGAALPVCVHIDKSGAAPNGILNMYVNGAYDYDASGVLGTAAQLTGKSVGTIASVTRLRIGGINTSPDFVGPISGFCLWPAVPTLAQFLAVDRWLCAIAGAGCRA